MLARRIERGDEDAKRRMVESNLLLVVPIAKRYRGQGVAFLDLIQDASLGLIRAVEKFDRRRDLKFFDLRDVVDPAGRTAIGRKRRPHHPASRAPGRSHPRGRPGRPGGRGAARP